MVTIIGLRLDKDPTRLTCFGIHFDIEDVGLGEKTLFVTDKIIDRHGNHIIIISRSILFILYLRITRSSERTQKEQASQCEKGENSTVI